MSDDPVIAELLRDAEAPDADSALERTVAQARRRSERPSRRRRWALGGLAVLCVAAISPPGQSLAEAIGELAGIGEEPTEPENRVGFGNNQAVVIGIGTSPDGTPYEVIAAHASDPEYALEGVTTEGAVTVNGGLKQFSYTDDCAGISVPENAQRSSGERVAQRLCLTPELYRSLEDDPITLSVTPETDLTEEPALRLSGFALGEAHDVRLELSTEAGTQTIEPEIYELDEELAAQIGASNPFRFYVAFAELEIRDFSEALGSAKAIALDADGEVLGENPVTTGVIYSGEGGEVRSANGEPAATSEVRRCQAAAGAPVDATLEERRDAIRSALSGGYECIFELSDKSGDPVAIGVTGP
jgi:hypothetical protein